MEFALKVVASFLVGGAYVALVTYIAEHVNPRMGGVLAGLPSTALIGLIFIALTQNNAAAARATIVVPASFGFTTILVAVYVGLRRSNGVAGAMLKAIGLWLVLATLTFSLLPRSQLLATIIFLICFVVTAVWLEKIKVESHQRLAISRQELLTRALAAGTLIAVAVSMAKVLGAFIGGIVATFPIMVITSLTILDLKRGKNLTTATARTMPFGFFGTVAFLIGFRFLVPDWGLPVGVAVSYAISVVFAVLALQFRLQLINKTN